MTAITFDSYHFVKDQTAAGMPEKQAEILANQQAKAMVELVTREVLRQELRLLESQMMTKIGTMIFALGGFLVALQYFHHG